MGDVVPEEHWPWRFGMAMERCWGGAVLMVLRVVWVVQVLSEGEILGGIMEGLGQPLKMRVMQVPTPPHPTTRSPRLRIDYPPLVVDIHVTGGSPCASLLIA